MLQECYGYSWGSYSVPNHPPVATHIGEALQKEGRGGGKFVFVFYSMSIVSYDYNVLYCLKVYDHLEFQ